jgi:hypothetical protein
VPLGFWRAAWPSGPLSPLRRRGGYGLKPALRTKTRLHGQGCRQPIAPRSAGNRMPAPGVVRFRRGLARGPFVSRHVLRHRNRGEYRINRVRLGVRHWRGDPPSEARADDGGTVPTLRVRSASDPRAVSRVWDASRERRMTRVNQRKLLPLNYQGTKPKPPFVWPPRGLMIGPGIFLLLLGLIVLHFLVP